MTAKKGIWYVIADDLDRSLAMTVLEWALFDRWRSVWGAAA